MKFYFFKHKRNRIDDPRIFSRTLREFKIEAETKQAAIRKYSKIPATTRPGKLSEDVIPMKLSPDDIVELFDVIEYNYAMHGNAQELIE